jgi:hypothetical protein
MLPWTTGISPEPLDERDAPGDERVSRTEKKALVAEPYLITEGGPLRRLERALRIARGDRYDWLRRSVAFFAVGYLPVLVFGCVFRLVNGSWIPAMTSVETHVRAIVSIPLLLAAELFVETRAITAGIYLVESGLVAPVINEYRAAIERTARLRNSVFAEVALLAASLGTVFVDSTFVGGTWVAAWGNLPMVIIARFLLFRWLWRWLLWSVFVARFARLRFVLRSTHPDRMAGLGPLLEPSYAFCAVVAAVSSSIAASWATLMIRANMPASTFYPMAATYAGLALLLIGLPACLLAVRLVQIRREGLRHYGAFAHRYARAFEDRWFFAGGTEALGAPDIQSLADLGGSYDVLTQIRVFPWTRRVVLFAVGCALLPMVPLLLLEVELGELVVRLVKAML